MATAVSGKQREIILKYGMSAFTFALTGLNKGQVRHYVTKYNLSIPDNATVNERVYEALRVYEGIEQQ